MPKITLPGVEMFAAAMTCLSKEETRYYLQGVFLEPAADGGVLMTATDGHRLFHGHVCADSPVEYFAPVIVKPGFKSLPAPWFRFDIPAEIDTDAGLIRRGSDVAAISVIDGTFPDYSRVFPSEPLSNEPANFNAAYLADFEKAGAILAGSKSRNGGRFAIAHNGDEPALIRFQGCSAAFGVLMPLRTPWLVPSRPALPGRMEAPAA